jgi:hypothetical protein
VRPHVSKVVGLLLPSCKNLTTFHVSYLLHWFFLVYTNTVTGSMYSVYFTNQMQKINYIWILRSYIRHVSVRRYYLQGDQCQSPKITCYLQGFFFFKSAVALLSRSQWPRGLRRRTSATLLLRLWVRIRQYLLRRSLGTWTIWTLRSDTFSSYSVFKLDETDSFT